MRAAYLLSRPRVCQMLAMYSGSLPWSMSDQQPPVPRRLSFLNKHEYIPAAEGTVNLPNRRGELGKPRLSCPISGELNRGLHDIAYTGDLIPE
jgi:hypothetical protein